MLLNAKGQSKLAFGELLIAYPQNLGKIKILGGNSSAGPAEFTSIRITRFTCKFGMGICVAESRRLAARHSNRQR
jgi:hypothetical protein